MMFIWRFMDPSRCFYASSVIAWLFFIFAVEARLRPRATTIPVPISIPPSQEWDGNDGPWSSFTVQVGTPAQDLKIFISTASSQTWVVAEEGCGSGDPTDCDKLRGGLYNYTSSTSWIPNIANVSNDIYALGLDAGLGYTGNGRYGFDDLTLGFEGGGGPELNNQTIAGIADKSFFLGLFGLAAKPNSWIDSNTSVPSFMQNLRNASKILSISWAYTAGNQYRPNEVLGSLTLGGYDASRFIPNNASFPFSTVDRGELSVQVQSISTGKGPISLLPTPISAYLDSSVPFIYLPIEACTLFENAFGITWNDSAQLYFITDTQRMLLTAQNPQIVFTLGSAAPNQVNITLPYSAFDLTASWPLVPNATRYFPLRRANDSSQYTLGRSFFQEAYMIADYERQNFSVSQCNWDGAAQTLVAILPPGGDIAGGSKLPLAAIIGIAIGGALISVVVVVLVFCFWYKPRRRKAKAAELAAEIREPAKTQEYIKPELDSNEVTTPRIEIYEADGHKMLPEMSADAVYEMPASEDPRAEMSASPVSPPSTTEQRWSRRRGDEQIGGIVEDLNKKAPTPETGTWSTVNSGWGERSGTLSDIVSPATPEATANKENVSERVSRKKFTESE